MKNITGHFIFPGKLLWHGKAKLDHDKGVTTQHCSSRRQARRIVLGGNTIPHSEDFYLREGVKYSPYCEQNTRLYLVLLGNKQKIANEIIFENDV